MAIQYLVPGDVYVNEGSSSLEYIIPGGSFENEITIFISINVHDTLIIFDT